MAANLLLYDRSDMGFRGVHCQGEDGPRQGVSQGHHDNQCCFGSGERGIHVWQPEDYLRVT